MSVINQALSAIDQQPAPTGPTPNGLPVSGPKRATSQRRLAIIVLAGGAAIAAMAGSDMGSLSRLVGGANANPTLAVPAAMTAGTGMEVSAPAPATEPAPAPAPLLATATATAAPVPLAAPTATPEPTRVQTTAAPVLPSSPPVAAIPPAQAAVAAPTRTPAPELHAAATMSVPAPIATPARIERRAAASTLPLPAGTRLWAKAVEQTNTGQRQAALLSLTELLQLEPSHHQGRHLAAVLEHESGATARAMALLAEGLTLDPRQADMAQLLARLQANQGQQDAALATLDRAAATGADADGLRAGILSQRGQFRDALPAYERALRGQPGNATWWAGLGVALESLHQPEPARQAYTKARAIGVGREDLASYVDQRLRALE